MLIAMGMAAFLCIGIGVLPGPLYDLLPFNAPYHPYTGDHVTSALGILLFTGLGFFMLLKKLDPEPTISVDTDWFYRKGARVFMWVASRPIQATDNAWGEFYRYCGMMPLMTFSRFWSWFDWNAIDGVVDGVARSVRGLGGGVRRLQSGQMQINMFYTVTAIAVLLVVFVFA